MNAHQEYRDSSMTLEPLKNPALLLTTPSPHHDDPSRLHSNLCWCASRGQDHFALLGLETLRNSIHNTRSESYGLERTANRQRDQ